LCLTYNHAEFIADALDSFLAQETVFEFEIVISDDCSTDNTLEAIERHGARLGHKLRVLRSAVNLGVTRNFRRALQACHGEYIALCEGDDFWRGTQKLQQQVDFLETHRDFVMTYHDATLEDATGEWAEARQAREPPRDASAEELVRTHPIRTLTVCFRNVLHDIPAELDHAPVLDICLWSLLGHHGGGKYLEGIEPAGYRVHQGGVFSMQSMQARRIMVAQSLLCLASVYQRRGQQALSAELLAKAVQTASVSMRPMLRARLIASNLLRLLSPAPRPS
jgi:hypothetical protein